MRKIFLWICKITLTIYIWIVFFVLNNLVFAADFNKAYIGITIMGGIDGPDAGDVYYGYSGIDSRLEFRYVDDIFCIGRIGYDVGYGFENGLYIAFMNDFFHKSQKVTFQYSGSLPSYDYYMDVNVDEWETCLGISAGITKFPLFNLYPPHEVIGFSGLGVSRLGLTCGLVVNNYKIDDEKLEHFFSSSQTGYYWGFISSTVLFESFSLELDAKFITYQGEKRLYGDRVMAQFGIQYLFPIYDF